MPYFRVHVITHHFFTVKAEDDFEAQDKAMECEFDSDDRAYHSCDIEVSFKFKNNASEDAMCPILEPPE